MLKNIALALFLTSTTASAQDFVFTSQQSCADYSTIIREIKDFGEEILFTGNMFQNHALVGPVWSEFAFLVNQETGSWSIVTLLDEDIGCYVASGINFEPYVK